MTGFGAAEGPLAGGRLAVEVRTANHRHFHPHVRLPIALQRYEGQVRERLRRRIERGHVALSARWSAEPAGAAVVRVDLERARAVHAALSALKRELGLSGEVDVELVAQQPGVLAVPEEGGVEVDPGELAVIVDQVVEQAVAMREREGAELGRDLSERLAAIERSLRAVELRAPQRLVAERDRLRALVRELSESADPAEGRLEQEIALLAEKLDIAEEMVRLASHVAACREALATGGGVGRRLAFLGQEMLREINTIGAKANDAAIARHVLDMKAALEAFREQVENVE